MSSTAAHYLYQEELYQFPRGVVIILSKSWENYLAEERTLLSKILGSLKIELAAVRIMAGPSINLQSLQSYHPSLVLIFGSEAEEIKCYEAVQAQGFSVIKADDLSELDENRKKSLWVALKQVAGI